MTAPASLARLVALAAIWGASFLFVRITSPVIGPVLTADLRMSIGGLSLAVWFAATGFNAGWRRWWPHYVVMGILTSALPFYLFAYGALSLPAGMLAVINATSPAWGALFAAWLLRERLSGRAIAGLILGVCGVAVITRPEAGADFAWLPALAATGAAACYGLSGSYMRRWAQDAPSRGMALGTQIAGGALLAPFIAFSPPLAAPTPLVIACVLALGVVCSAVAYILYFRLVTDIGPAGALTVTYLIPIFGVTWGALFLGETISLWMVGGGALVLLGTYLVLRR